MFPVCIMPEDTAHSGGITHQDSRQDSLIADFGSRLEHRLFQLDFLEFRRETVFPQDVTGTVFTLSDGGIDQGMPPVPDSVIIIRDKPSGADPPAATAFFHDKRLHSVFSGDDCGNRPGGSAACNDHIIFFIRSRPLAPDRSAIGYHGTDHSSTSPEKPASRAAAA